LKERTEECQFFLTRRLKFREISAQANDAIVFYDGECWNRADNLATIPRGSTLTLHFVSETVTFMGFDGLDPNRTLKDFLILHPDAAHNDDTIHNIFTCQVGDSRQTLIRPSKLFSVEDLQREAFVIAENPGRISAGIHFDSDSVEAGFSYDQTIIDVREKLMIELKPPLTLNVSHLKLYFKGRLLHDKDFLCDIAYVTTTGIEIEARQESALIFLDGERECPEDLPQLTARDVAERWCDQIPTGSAVSLVAFGRELGPGEPLKSLGLSDFAQVFVHIRDRRL
jgi:hypothetical protein